MKKEGAKLCMKRIAKFLVVCCLFSSAGAMEAIPPTSVTEGSVSVAQQNRRVSGIISDSKGEPIIGANVVVKGTTNGSVTDYEGKYTIEEVPTGAVLQISYVGFLTTEENVGNRSVVNVTLEEDSQALGEVVVTALGIERNTRTLSYSTTTLDAGDLLTVRDNTANMLSSLRGKIAGANVFTGSGIGSATGIVLRGNRSISGNDNAMIVVDGVPIVNAWGSQTTSEGRSYNGTDGSDLNADDIISINVLKGAAAAALYGSSAANGAIIITTKKGKEGKISLTYNGSVSVDQPVYLMDFQNTYGRGNSGVYSSTAGQSWGAVSECYPDNVSSFFQLGTTVNNSVSIQGGTEKLQGYASYTNNLTTGNVPDNKMNKNTLNVRVNANPIPRLTADAKITYTQYKLDNIVGVGDVGLAMSTYIMPRDMSVEESRDYETIGDDGTPSRKYWTTSSVFDNPYWINNRTGYDEERNRINVLGSVKLDIFDWLSIQGRYSYNMLDNLNTQYAYEGTVFITITDGGYYGEWRRKNTRSYMDVLISGNNRFFDNMFGISYNAGASKKNDKYTYTGVYSNALTKTNSFSITFLDNPTTTYDSYEKEIHSVYGTVEVDYNNAIYLEATARQDWSSTLPSPYHYFYPSVGGSVVLNDLVKMPKWIDLLKLRASWAKVGSSPDAYQLQQTYSYASSGSGAVVPSSVKMNSELKPEETKSWEVGLDWRFLGQRLGIDFTYYQSSTINQLISASVPVSSGYSTAYVNAGQIDNKGIELSITGFPVMTKDFSWQTTFNLAHNSNEVVELMEGVTSVQLAGSGKYGYVELVEGEPVGVLTGYAWKRDEETGKYIVDDNGLPVSTDEFVEVGNYNPKVTMGWSNTFKYKNFSLYMLIDGRIGGTIISGTDGMMAYYGVADYTEAYRDGGWVLDAVTEDGEQNTKEITAEEFWTTVSGGRYGWAEFFTYSATNFRLRELSIGYDFNLRSDFFIKKANVSLAGRNLFFFYKGKSKLDIPGLDDRTIPIDPDQSMSAGTLQGLEFGLSPSTRSFSLNLSLTF